MVCFEAHQKLGERVTGESGAEHIGNLKDGARTTRERSAFIGVPSAFPLSWLLTNPKNPIKIWLARRPGELGLAASRLGENQINIDYSYCGLELGSARALVVLPEPQTCWTIWPPNIRNKLGALITARRCLMPAQ
jgi:hypothetical protein